MRILVSEYGDPWNFLRQRRTRGNFPDIVQIMGYEVVPKYASQGALADLSRESFSDSLLPGAKDAVSHQGKLFALPLGFHGIGVIYNKKIFSRLGLTVPQTLTELKLCVQSLEKSHVTPFAGLLKSSWPTGHFISLVHTSLLGARDGTPGIFQFLEKMNHRKTSFGKAVPFREVTEILDWYCSHMGENPAEMDWEEQQEVFAQGKAAMMVQGLWSYQAVILRNPDLQCGFFPFPTTGEPKDTKFFADLDSALGISSSSTPEKQQAARDFLNWLTTPETQQLWLREMGGTLSFQNTDFSSLPEPFQDLMRSVSAKGYYPWAFNHYPVNTFEGAMKESGQAYVLGQKTAAQLVKDIDESWTRGTD